MEDNSILEPLKMYNSLYKNKVDQEAKNFIDSLVKQASIDEQLNQTTVKEYDKAVAKQKKVGSKLSTLKGLKGFLIFLTVLFFVGTTICVLIGIAMPEVRNEGFNLGILIIVGVICLILGIGMILIITLKLNKQINEQDAKYKEITNKVNGLLSQCYAQVKGLNDLFDWRMPPRIIKKAVPLLQFDDYFDVSKLQYMNDKYNFDDSGDKNSSVVYVLSGSIVGNPFLVIRSLDTYTYQKTYTGSITISWVQTEYQNGRSVSVTKTQTLTASVTKPAPAYEYFTYLVYANDAAPDLIFSRKPLGRTFENEKQIDKYVDSESKDLENFAEEAVKKGLKFTPMTNLEFETLFHAWDRNNEQQFRLLFTPLAQQNLKDLITSKEPYGDDFTINKRKCINYVSTKHSQHTDIYCNPASYYHYDVKVIREKFVSYVNEYFKSIYFDLAPLLSIPIYQQTKPFEYIYGKPYSKNYTNFEEETIINSFPQYKFLEQSSTTKGILKINQVEKKGKVDRVVVRASSYRAEPRVDYIGVYGGDGHLHSVPVHWDEYIPLTKDTSVGIKRLDADRNDFSNKGDAISERLQLGGDNEAIYSKGFFAYLQDIDDSQVDSVLDELFGYNDNDNKEDK